MIRLLLFALFIGACCLVSPNDLAAQDWPTFQNTPTPDVHYIDRGPSWYFAIWKLVLCTVFFLIWVKLAEFINTDAQEYGEETEMPPEIWNPIVMFSFFAGFLFVITFPIFLIGFPIYLASILAPVLTYVFTRNSKVDPEDTIFTKAHLKRRKERKLRKKGVMPAAKVLPQDMGPQIEFKPIGGDPIKTQAAYIQARNIPAYLTLKEILYNSLWLRTDQFVMDFTRDQVAFRQQIDGFFHPLAPMDRPTGDAMLYALKLLANMNPQERRAKQTGRFAISIPDKKFECQVTSQGVKTGERVLLKFIGKKKKPLSLIELGMHPKMEANLREFLNNPGFVLVACRPGDGYTTSWNAVLSSADRILRDFHSLTLKGEEDDTEAENIDVNEIDPQQGKSPEEVLRSLALKMPDAYVLPKLISGKVLDMLTDLAAEQDRFVITRVPAKNPAEAVVRLLALKPNRTTLAKAMTAVLYSRLARRLCDYCKQPYQPSPQLLKKLRLTAAQVPKLYREYQPPPPEELVDEKGRPIEPPVCQVCGGLGYIGRVAIFELLVVDDEIRKVIVHDPRVEAIEQVARKQGHQGLQATGLQLVVAGITSLSELQRVLKD